MYAKLTRTLLLALAGLVLSAAVSAAGKPAKAVVRPENPEPFGLVFGKLKSQEALELLKSNGAKIVESGNRVIKDDISNPAVAGYFLEGVPIDGVTTTRVWFMGDVLMRFTYVLSGSFEPFLDQLTARYGAPARRTSGFGGEEHAVWYFKEVELALDRPFMGETTLDYIHSPLFRRSRESDARHYEEVTRAMGKKQKGF